eukprot:NODE_15862_length_1025_cov_7.206013.p1 GENE.NODE_15862_length_1025_cov_7.206013~~NODE_15862_length_1025_cov_7.206013.p1  ORF type:complete len:223 (-),score=50.87 NODE_15862_length_1025_cov_7.206013:276-944(-)
MSAMARMLFLAAFVLATGVAQEIDDTTNHTHSEVDTGRRLWHHCLHYEQTTRVTCAWDVNAHECHKMGCCWHAGRDKCYKNHDMCVDRRCGHVHWGRRKCEDHGCCWSNHRRSCFHHRFVGSGSFASSSSGSSSSSSAGASSSLPMWLLILFLILVIGFLIACVVVVILRRCGGKKDKKKKKSGDTRAINLTATASGGVVTTQPAFSAMASPVPVVQASFAN